MIQLMHVFSQRSNLIRRLVAEVRHLRGLLNKEPEAIRLEVTRQQAVYEVGNHWFAMVLAYAARDAIDAVPEAKNYLEWTLNPADGSSPIIVQIRRKHGGREPSELITELRATLADLCSIADSNCTPQEADWRWQRARNLLSGVGDGRSAAESKLEEILQLVRESDDPTDKLIANIATR
jgi:hypothetical protein